MKQSKFDQTKDQAIADRPHYEVGFTPDLMCQAHGCPNRWSVDMGSRLCSAHAWAEPNRWPEITQHQQWNETERAQARGQNRDEQLPSMTRREKVAVLERLRTVLTEPKNPRAWIATLRAKRDRGEPLSAAQKHALEQVKHVAP